MNSAVSDEVTYPFTQWIPIVELIHEDGIISQERTRSTFS